ncbi:MAG: DNA mismatch repair protein MutS [Candidatus Omnitrophica bacterium]|nr:DNA mismatch repair protein MutS [Candidatus Omnitrophota bacterium]
METSTPMLRQYGEIKSAYKDCILFFRLGDFYEMFYEDAQTASQILDLVLTSRGQDVNGKIPMCGVPYHAADNYVSRLVRAGKKVAICEQVEDPALAKGIVKRDVIRVITAGTFLDDSSDARYLVSIASQGKNFGLAFTDTASGSIQTNQFTSVHQTLEILSKIPINECIFSESHEEAVKKLLTHPMLRLKNVALTGFRDWSFEPERAKKMLQEHFGTHSLRGFGIEDLPLAQASAGALIEYLRDMNKTSLKHVDRLSRYDDTDYVFISPAAHYGLELERLLQTIDRTVTSMGRRLMRAWMYHPLKDVGRIRERQDAVAFLQKDVSSREALASRLLPGIPDIEKSLSRLSCGSGAPRDLLAIRQALVRAPEFQIMLKSLADKSALFHVSDPKSLREKLEAAINPDMPLAKNEGKVIRSGFNVELDELRGLQEKGLTWLSEYQAREVKRTGINSLKVGFNRVFGYYIEITNAQLKSAPADYTRKQTLTNGERFITPELKEYEHKILTAQDKVFKIEADLIREMTSEILAEMSAVHSFAREIARVDVLFALSLLSIQRQWVRPDVSDGTELLIEEGRHPVVESAMGTDFIPNDTRMDCEDNRLIILTGPNMSGKSTYIRQNAVLVILAQMGSFVPAASARIGLVDKIFTRIGAHDEITKGQSTFMVEMTEAADILNNLTPRSLVVLDEIGRGTSTYDGLSLAWALAEFLQDKKARTLFATHFHELTLLSERLKGVRNYNVQVREWEDKVIFMHKIVPGGTDDSYGLYVAKLAGMPLKVLNRAQKILTDLESGGNLKERLQGPKFGEPQAEFFGKVKSDPVAEEIRATLEAMDVNNLTPIQALHKLGELKAAVEENEGVV